MVFGTIDEEDLLQEDEVYVCITGIGFHEGRVMVTRHPG
jgi:hypothetical protein